MTEGDILELIDRFYDAALDEKSWPHVLQDLARAFGGVGTTMLSLSGAPLLGVSPDLQEAADAYTKGWWEKDAFLSYAKEAKLGPGIHVDSDYLTDEFRARNEFYQDFMRPQRLSGIMSVLTSPYEGTLIAINVQRRIGRGAVTLDDRKRFALLSRHVGRAAALAMRLSTAESLNAGLANRLGEFDCAVAVVGRDGRLLISNAAFDALRTEGIEVRRGRVCVSRGDMQPALQALIWCALDGTLGRTGPDTLVVPRPENLLPLLIRAVPVTPEQAERHIGAIPARAVMLMVLNPSHGAYPDLTNALQALGLTPAQARVALAVGSGQSPREVAEALKVSEATVRTTVKHVYSRLGIDRQSQLARLVSRAIPFSS